MTTPHVFLQGYGSYYFNLGFRSCGLLCIVVGWVVPDVLKEHCASSSGAKGSQKSAKHGMDKLKNYTCMVCAG